jgi:hypothetical protein
MSTYTMPQSIAYTSLLRPSSGEQPGTRLPSLQQLLLPHPLVALNQPSAHPQNPPDQPRLFSSATSSGLSEISPSPSKRASQGSVRTSQLVQSDFHIPGAQSTGASSISPTTAMSHEPSYLVQVPQQQSSQMSPFRESWLSPPSHIYSSTHPDQFRQLSPNSKYHAGSPGLETTRQSSAPYVVDRYSHGPVRTHSRHDAPHQRDWGTTKAGKPRKRLAQACLNCRHKKIRCHSNPSSIKCTQCTRTDVHCMFESGCVVCKGDPALRG